MAAHSGKKITTDGLVFHFDMENTTKSFKGKPTTNVMSGNVARKNAAENPLNVGTHASIARTTEIVYYSAKRPNVLKYYSTNNTGYAMLNNQFSIENQSGTVYSYSFDYLILRGSTANPFAPTIYGNGYKNPTSGNTGTNRVTTDTLLDDGWTRRTTTYTAGHTGYNYLRVNLSTTGTNNIITNNNGEGDFEILFDNFQMEEGIPSPFTEGTRSNTDAIKDLSGLNNTITPINLSYNSDNTFQFDGTDDQFNGPTWGQITGRSGSTGEISMEMWYRLDENPSQDFLGYFGFNGTNNYFRVFSNGQRVWIDYYNTTTSSRHQTTDFILSGTDWNNHGEGVWNHICVTYDESTIKTYHNGNFKEQSTGTLSDLTPRSFQVGGGMGYYTFQGKMSQGKLYNKALTPSEIRKNFIATKDRFGL
jgi:hypothetical protein